MKITEKARIIQINHEFHPIESEVKNWAGFNVTIPACSLLFVEKCDRNGNPIYESVGLQYIKQDGVEEGLELELEPTAEMEVSIEKAKEAPYTKYTIDDTPKPRVVHGAQFFRNRKTGQPFFCDEEFFISELKKTTWDCGVGLHDIDLYTSSEVKDHLETLRKSYFRTGATDEAGLADYIALNQIIFEGNQKPPHIHIPIGGKRGKNGRRDPLRLCTICNRLHIPDTCFKIVHSNEKNGGDDGLLDACRYLEHTTEKAIADGKTEYNNDWFWFSFDWKSAIEKRDADKMKYGQVLSGFEELLMKVRREGMSLREAEQMYPVLYEKNEERLKKARLNYIYSQPSPPCRICFYIEGSSGNGKGTASRMLASVLRPDLSIEDRYYSMGGRNVTFEGYDGQPIIIWNEARPRTVLAQLGGRDNAFNVFDTHPEKIRQNVKNSSVNLTNSVFILNSTMPYEEFLDELCAGYRDKDGNQCEADADKKQAYRRFPFIIKVDLEYLEFLVNKGYIEDSDYYYDFFQYYNLGKIKANLRRLVKIKGNEEIKEEAIKKIFQKPKNFYEEQYKLCTEETILTEEDLLELSLYGEEMEQEEKSEEKVITLGDYHELEKQVEYFRSLWQSSVKNVAEYKGRLEEAGLLTEWEQMMPD